MQEEASPVPPLDPEALARLAGGLAHELKNPLSTLSLQLGLLREEWLEDDDPRARRSVRTLESLQEEVGHLNEILEDFLRFARTDRLELEPCSLNALVERVVQFVAPEAQARGVRLETYLDVDLPLLPLDPGRIRQALLNLLVNSRQALDLDGRGGEITVITRREGPEAVLEVVDDGPGMAPEVLERSREIYFSTKRQGSGLGLATVQRIVAAHGGRLEIASTPGHGTRVLLRLPLAAGGGRETPAAGE